MAARLHYSVQMPTLSHLEPINEINDSVRHEVTSLSGAFAEFISASTRLEASYGKLQLEVSSLSCELADRNVALKASLDENKRVHRSLKQIVNSMPCGVLVVEAGGVVSMINPEGRRLLDLDADSEMHLQAISEQAGVDLLSFLHRPTRDEEEQEFSRLSLKGKRWLAVRDRCLFGADELALSWAGRQQTILILRDVTYHKQAEQERERGRRATALSEVASTLAHEIRNPLASLELFAGLIAGGGTDTAEWISHLQAGIRSMAGTVNNVLSISGIGFPALVPLNVTESIRSSVGFVKPIAEQAGVILTFSADEGEILIRGNSGALQQLVLNLLCNAIRHTSKGGMVCVSVRRTFYVDRGNLGLALLEFTDTGSGIAPEHLNDIFRAGFSGTGDSSGLGLAVCEQIVRQHEGGIRVASTLGVGTKFFVEIPTL